MGLDGCNPALPLVQRASRRSEPPPAPTIAKQDRSVLKRTTATAEACQEKEAPMTYRRIQTWLLAIVLVPALATVVGIYAHFTGAWPVQAWPLTTVSGVLSVWGFILCSGRLTSSTKSETETSDTALP